MATEEQSPAPAKESVAEEEQTLDSLKKEEAELEAREAEEGNANAATDQQIKDDMAEAEANQQKIKDLTKDVQKKKKRQRHLQSTDADLSGVNFGVKTASSETDGTSESTASSSTAAIKDEPSAPVSSNEADDMVGSIDMMDVPNQVAEEDSIRERSTAKELEERLREEANKIYTAQVTNPIGSSVQRFSRFVVCFVSALGACAIYFFQDDADATFDMYETYLTPYGPFWVLGVWQGVLCVYTSMSIVIANRCWVESSLHIVVANILMMTWLVLWARGDLQWGLICITLAAMCYVRVCETVSNCVHGALVVDSTRLLQTMSYTRAVVLREKKKYFVRDSKRERAATWFGQLVLSAHAAQYVYLSAVCYSSVLQKQMSSNVDSFTDNFAIFLPILVIFMQRTRGPTFIVPLILIQYTMRTDQWSVVLYLIVSLLAIMLADFGGCMCIGTEKELDYANDTEEAIFKVMKSAMLSSDKDSKDALSNFLSVAIKADIDVNEIKDMGGSSTEMTNITEKVDSAVGFAAKFVPDALKPARKPLTVAISDLS